MIQDLKIFTQFLVCCLKNNVVSFEVILILIAQRLLQIYFHLFMFVLTGGVVMFSYELGACLCKVQGAVRHIIFLCKAWDV